MLRRLAVVVLGVTAVLPASAAHAADAEPSINAASTVVAPGDQVLVRGSNFPAGQLVRLAVCGNAAARGAMDCAQEASQIVPPTQSGAFQTPIPVVVPPQPCPCVIQAGGPSLTTPVLLPLRIIGVATAPVQRSASSQSQSLRVVKTNLSGWGPLSAWFGAGPRRTLELTLRNKANDPVTLPPFTLMRGRGAHPDTIVDAVELDQLAAGETRTFRIPVHFDAVAIGSYTVTGSINSQGVPVTFKATTFAAPWALALLAAGCVQLVLVWVRNRGREALLRHEPIPALQPLLAATVDLLHYWSGRIEPARRELAAGPLVVERVWTVDLTGAAWQEPTPAPVEGPTLVLTDEEPRWELEPIAVPELQPDFKTGTRRHARRTRSARRGAGSWKPRI